MTPLQYKHYFRFMRRGILKYLLNKYAITGLAFMVYLLFVSNNDLFTQYKNIQTLNKLEQEQQELLETMESNRNKLTQLSTDMDMLERFARENYRMKKPNEVIYVISTGN